MAIETLKAQIENEEGCGIMVDKRKEYFKKKEIINKEMSLTAKLRRMLENYTDTMVLQMVRFHSCL